MRLLILSFSVFCLLSPVWGQSQFTFAPPTDVAEDVAYIHVLHKAETGTLLGLRLRTIFTPEDPVKVSPNSYTLLKVSEDHIGFFSNNSEQTQPWLMDLERGKHYFLRFTRMGFELNVDELTEREFEMELFFNNIDVEPKRTYELGMPGS